MLLPFFLIRLFIYMIEIKVGIVEDSIKSREELNDLIKKFQTSTYDFLISNYENGDLFLKKLKKSTFDIIFLDIDLPGKNGFEIAKDIRNIDNEVIIIFVTNLAQFAINGYSVKAFDFILKPLNKDKFNQTFYRVIEELNHKYNDEYIIVSYKSETLKIPINDIYYIEVSGHNLIFHLVNGVKQVRGSLTNLETKLNKFNFSRCNNPYLVNLKYVTSFKGEYIYILNNDKIRISQTKRKSFLSDLNNYIGE